MTSIKYPVVLIRFAVKFGEVEREKEERYTRGNSESEYVVNS